VLEKYESAVRPSNHRALKEKGMKAKKYSVEEVEFIKNNYGRISIKEMSEKLGRNSNHSVRNKIYKLGLSVNGRTYPPNVNISFFENWSQELAYVIGFFLADGHMSDHPKTSSYSICFSVIDKDIIEKIANVCGYKNAVRKYICGTTIMYSIDISGKLIWKFFENLGFTHNKTFTTRIPKQIPPKLMSHFIRGVFDGDGSLHLKSTLYPQANIVGSKLFIDDVSKIGVEYSSIASHYRSFIIYYNGQKAINFFDYIYKDATIYMDRKYKRYLKALKWESSYNFWADQELELLNSLGPVTDMDQLVSVFNRSCSAIREKASKLSIKIKSKAAILWSNTDIRLLKSIYPTENTREIADIFNRSIGSIRYKAHKLGIKKENTKRKRSTSWQRTLT
jgi:hypothetical protein